ncbi:unnamed protein product, partial [Iphiclides podalirius]
MDPVLVSGRRIRRRAVAGGSSRASLARAGRAGLTMAREENIGLRVRLDALVQSAAKKRVLKVRNRKDSCWWVAISRSWRCRICDKPVVIALIKVVVHARGGRSDQWAVYPS